MLNVDYALQYTGHNGKQVAKFLGLEYYEGAIHTMFLEYDGEELLVQPDQWLVKYMGHRIFIF